jgi:osmotically-inducible protein OsmY
VSDVSLEAAVKAELMADPKVDHTEIAVSADNEIVTLRGTVGSLRQKVEAGRDAKRVHGVVDVMNNLEVRILIGDQRDDAELRGLVLQALMLNSLVPSSIDAKAEGGFVTLTGHVNWNYERDEAEVTAGNVPGVHGIRSEIVLDPVSSAADVEDTIGQALERLAEVDANTLKVKTAKGTVTLSGTVSSWAAHDAALNAAWWTPGVTKVVDHIEVQY